MVRLNLKEASLLDASGELSRTAREKLLSQMALNSAAAAAHEAARENLDMLSALPIPEPSAAERRFIPMMIKKAVHAALAQQEKQANRVRMLVRWAAGALSLAACAGLCAMLMGANWTQSARHREQIARIDATINQVTLPASRDMVARDNLPRPTDSPTLSYMNDKGMGNLFNSMAAPEESAPTEASDPSAPPGSF